MIILIIVPIPCNTVLWIILNVAKWRKRQAQAHVNLLNVTKSHVTKSIKSPR